MAVIGIFLLTQSTGLLAREPAEQSWKNLKQLKVGHEIQVVQMNIKSLQGTFLGVSEEVISLRVQENEAALPRADVLRVSLREKSKRLRNTLIGLGVGSAAGGLALWLWARKAQPISRFRGEYYDIGKLTILPIGIGIGAGVGAAIPSHPTIYRAKKSRRR